MSSMVRKERCPAFRHLQKAMYSQCACYVVEKDYATESDITAHRHDIHPRLVLEHQSLTEHQPNNSLMVLGCLKAQASFSHWASEVL